MPLPITNISDFVGEKQLQEDGNTENKFDVIRDEYENSYIYKLLGAELGKLFIADLDANGVPQTQRFIDIYNAFAEDVTSGNYYYYPYCTEKVIESKGMKEYLMGIVWFFFARNNPMLVTTGGNKVSTSENSINSYDGATLGVIYNKAVKTAQAIQWYICDNIADYPEYKGQEIRLVLQN